MTPHDDTQSQSWAHARISSLLGWLMDENCWKNVEEFHAVTRVGVHRGIAALARCWVTRKCFPECKVSHVECVFCLEELRSRPKRRGSKRSYTWWWLGSEKLLGDTIAPSNLQRNHQCHNQLIYFELLFLLFDNYPNVLSVSFNGLGRGLTIIQ